MFLGSQGSTDALAANMPDILAHLPPSFSLPRPFQYTHNTHTQHTQHTHTTHTPVKLIKVVVVVDWVSGSEDSPPPLYLVFHLLFNLSLSPPLPSPPLPSSLC